MFVDFGGEGGFASDFERGFIVALTFWSTIGVCGWRVISGCALLADAQNDGCCGTLKIKAVSVYRGSLCTYVVSLLFAG